MSKTSGAAKRSHGQYIALLEKRRDWLRLRIRQSGNRPLGLDAAEASALDYAIDHLIWCVLRTTGPVSDPATAEKEESADG